MTMMKVYVTYDVDAETYNTRTFMAENNKMAIRILNDAAMDDKRFLRSLDKFVLYKLAKYDDENGEMIPEKEEIGNCKDLCGTAITNEQ